MRLLEFTKVRATAEGKLKVLGVPFNGPGNRDRLGEFITKRTDIMLDEGDRRPVLMHHGFDENKRPKFRPKVVGTAELSETTSEGHWFEVTLRGAQDFINDLIEKAREGVLKASTGAVSHLVRTNNDGHVDVWPVGELSLVDTSQGQVPVSDLAVAVPMRAWFEDAGIEYPFEPEAEEAARAEEDPAPDRIRIVKRTVRIK